MFRRVAIPAVVALLSLVLCFGLASAVGIVTPKQVQLASGTTGNIVWRVLTHRPHKGVDANRRPCLDILVDQGAGRKKTLTHLEGCGSVTPYPNAIEYAAGQGRNERAVVAFAFDVRVRRMMVDLGSRGKRWSKLRLLPFIKARKAGLKQFRFGVIDISGRHCVRRVAGFDATGAQVVNMRQGKCG